MISVIPVRWGRGDSTPAEHVLKRDVGFTGNNSITQLRTSYWHTAGYVSWCWWRVHRGNKIESVIRMRTQRRKTRKFTTLVRLRGKVNLWLRLCVSHRVNHWAGLSEANHILWVVTARMDVVDQFSKQWQTSQHINRREYHKQPTNRTLVAMSGELPPADPFSPKQICRFIISCWIYKCHS